MLNVGSKFYTFDELSATLEEFQKEEQVQLWVRDSRTVTAAAKRARRKTLNPDLRYAELTYSCVFGGRRPSDQTKTHNQTSAGGCPFKVRLSTSCDGQALVVKEICQEHNHEPGKKLHDEPRRLYKARSRNGGRRGARIVNKNEINGYPSGVCQDDQPSKSAATTLAPLQHLQLQPFTTIERTKKSPKDDYFEKDLPMYIDTPDYSCSPDLSGNYESYLTSVPETEPFYSCINFPPSPISPPTPVSPSSNSLFPITGERAPNISDDEIEPIVDLDVALEEALGNLDSVDKMPCFVPSSTSQSKPTVAGRASDTSFPILSEVTSEVPASRKTKSDIPGYDRPESSELPMSKKLKTEPDIPDLDHMSVRDMVKFDILLF